MPFEKINSVLPRACETLEWRFSRATEEEVNEGIKLENQRYKKQLKDSIGE